MNDLDSVRMKLITVKKKKGKLLEEAVAVKRGADVSIEESTSDPKRVKKD